MEILIDNKFNPNLLGAFVEVKEYESKESKRPLDTYVAIVAAVNSGVIEINYVRKSSSLGYCYIRKTSLIHPGVKTPIDPPYSIEVICSGLRRFGNEDIR